MFVSFFPKPKLFFASFVIWCAVAVGFWYFAGRDLGASFGMPPAAADALGRTPTELTLIVEGAAEPRGLAVAALRLAEAH